MTNQEANMILSRHLMQCGMMMPIEWVQKNGDDSEFMQAYKMAMDALKNEPVRCKDCKWYRIAPIDNVPYCFHESGYCGEHMGGLFYCAFGERRTDG